MKYLNFGYAEEIEERSKENISSLKNLENEAGAVGHKVAGAFEAAVESIEELTGALENVAEPIVLISDNLGLMTQIDFSGIGEYLSGISAALMDVQEILCGTDWIGVTGLIMEVFAQGFGFYQWMNPDIITSAAGATTALGAAMDFLTSPIGLVTAGIAMLIAVIVMLVANWDTVTAALASFDAWPTGIFAVNWTNQFGAFGEVLNAFFANVENIWNAVKTIFNGIVDFVKGVFAGDWQKGRQREAVCFRKCCKGAMLPKADDPRRRVVGLIMIEGGCLCGHERGGLFF